MAIANTAMPRPPRRWFRLFGGAAVVFLVLVLAVAWFARRPLTALAFGAGLSRAGAGEVHFSVREASPWRVEIADLSFRVRSKTFSARTISITRDGLWQRSFGTVHIAGGRIPLVVDGSDVNPQAWSSYTGQRRVAGPVAIPAQKLEFDCVIVVQAAGVPDRELPLQVEARESGAGVWTATGVLDGPATSMRATATYEAGPDRLTFQVPAAALDLGAWRDFIQRAIVLPGGAWDVAGKFSGTAEGAWADHALRLAGQVRLQDGTLANAGRNVALTGIDAALDFTDLNHLQSKPGSIHARELRAGNLVASDLDFHLAFRDADHLAVSAATLRVLGGRLTAEPFVLQLDRGELEATVQADSLDIAEILALAKDVPATAVGRVNGRVPIRINSAGLRFGTGWLELTPGVRAEVQLRAKGMLTSGVAPSNASFPVLQKVENGLLRLRLTEMRIDLHPPNAPAGRSAELHFAGEPVDPSVKAPVSLDVNINGPLEQLVNFGFDRRVNFGGGK